MNYTTPLPEVARLLEPETAQLLVYLPFEMQELCLEALRVFVVELEFQGVVLDPIRMGEVLHAVIIRWLTQALWPC